MPARICARAPSTSRPTRRPADEHEHVGAERRGLLDRGPVVGVRGAQAGRVGGGEEAAAAEARHAQPGGADQPGRPLDADLRDLVAPRPDHRQARPPAGVDRLRQAALVDRDLVEAEPGEVGPGAHPWSTPASSSTARMRAAASSGSRSSAAASASTNSSARCVDRARALLAADHPEVALVPVEVGEEDDAGLVAVGRRLEDVAGERHGRREDLLVAVEVAVVERGERRRRGRRDRVEDPEQRVAVAAHVAADQRRVVEVVARVHADALRQPPAQRDLAVGVEQRDLHAVDLRDVLVDDREQRVAGGVEVVVAPVAGERRVEGGAEPVQDRRPLERAEHVAVGLGVVLRVQRGGGERAAGHQDHLGAGALDERALLLVRGADDREVEVGRRRQVVGARAGGDRPAHRPRLGDAAADQLAADRPVEAHAALGGVHRLGDGEPVLPQVAAEGERRLPVELRRPVGVAGGERVGDDVGGGERDAAPRRAGGRPVGRRGAGRVGLDRAARARQPECGGDAHSASSGTSTKRRSSQLCSPSSASWIPFAASRKSHGNGSS